MPAIYPCGCGGRGVVKCEQVAEDGCETWVECSRCGNTSEPVDYPYGASEQAILNWNAGDRAVMR